MFQQLVYELSRGFAYRAISHSEMRIYTTWLPLALTAAFAVIYSLLPVQPALVGKGGLIEGAMTLVSTLPGFYFAGLAAVSTFGASSMDHEMSDPAPTVKMRVRGQMVELKLTRRLFLSYLFSYLVVLSFTLWLTLLLANALTPSLEEFRKNIDLWLGSEWPWFSVQAGLGLIVTFGFASLVVSTLHGVFFLTEKMHQP